MVEKPLAETRSHLSVNLSASAFQTLPSPSLALSWLHTASTFAISLKCIFLDTFIEGWHLIYPPSIEKATDQFQQLRWEIIKRGFL